MKCQLENISVNYEMVGEGRPLLFFPGWTSDARFSAYLMEPMFRQRPGWKRYYVDPPGHGKTPGEAWVTNLDKMLEVMLQFVDAVIPGQRFAVAGHSLGAHLARGILYHRPQDVTGLLMLAPVDRAGHFLEEKMPLIGSLTREWLFRVEESIAAQ